MEGGAAAAVEEEELLGGGQEEDLAMQSGMTLEALGALMQ